MECSKFETSLGQYSIAFLDFFILAISSFINFSIMICSRHYFQFKFHLMKHFLQNIHYYTH